MDTYTMYREGDDRDFVIYRPGGTEIAFRIEARYHRVAKQLFTNLNDPGYTPGD